MPSNLSLRPGEAQMALKFAVTGVLNTVVGLAFIIGSRELLGWSEYAANAIGYAAGLTFGFAMNRGWTFTHRGDLRRSVPRYLLAFAIAYSANLFMLAACLNTLRLHGNLAQACAMVTYSAIFFVLCRVFVFRRALA
jgi:putative flippase GtrA